MQKIIKKTIISLALVTSYLINSANAQEFKAQTPPENIEVFGKWGKSCEASPENKDMKACYISQNIMMQDNVILSVAIGKLPKVPEPVLAITTPLRTFLPAGIKVQVDDQEAQTLPHEFCDTSGCFLRVGVKQQMIDSMKKGNNLNVSFRDARGQELKIPVSLSGFTKGYSVL